MTEENKQKVMYLKGYERQLNTIICCKRTIETLLGDIEELRRDVSEAKCQPITGLPGTHNKKDLSDYIVKIEESEENIEKLINKINIAKQQAAEECTKIYTAVNMMNTQEYKNILIYKHIQRKSWKDIADFYGYTRGGIYKIYLKALDEFKIP